MDDITKITEIIENILVKFKKEYDEFLIVWEHKKLNIHRGIIYWKPDIQLNCPELSSQIRQKVLNKFKVSWWRGFAFGAVLEVQNIPDDFKLVANDIDIRNNGKGTWQWAIFICHKQKMVLAVHTWMVVFLTPIYQAILDVFKSAGYDVGDYKKE